MKLADLLHGNVKEYEELISLLYKIGELTNEPVEPIVAKLDDIYDKEND